MTTHESGQGTQGVSRRTMLGGTLATAAGAMLAGRAGAKAAAKAAAPKLGKAKSVIQVWLWGGPCHIDTFDPKPEAGSDYCGPLDSPIETNVKGIRIGQLLPELAKLADKYSLIRSMTHGSNGHETASYMTQTGHKAGGRDTYPCAGGVVNLYKGYDGGYKGLIPPYIVLTNPQGRFSEAGFLGTRYKPFATGGDPSRTPFQVEGITAPGITRQRQAARRDLLHELDQLRQAVKDSPDMKKLAKAEGKAYDLILGDAGKVFDLTTVSDEVRQAYGRSKLGQSCLMARRLVEKGVPYVTINSNGWDTHKEHFKIMNTKLPQLDQGLSMLLKELDERGLLETTIVWCCGEFGRGPKVQMESPWNGGRSHYGAVFSALVAGGGFKGGRVVGSSDARGEHVKDRPVYPWDLLGSMYTLLGIDPTARLPHPRQHVCRVTPTAEEGYKIGGLLKEIM